MHTIQVHCFYFERDYCCLFSIYVCVCMPTHFHSPISSVLHNSPSFSWCPLAKLIAHPDLLNHLAYLKFNMYQSWLRKETRYCIILEEWTIFAHHKAFIWKIHYVILSHLYCSSIHTIMVRSQHWPWLVDNIISDSFVGPTLVLSADCVKWMPQNKLLRVTSSCDMFRRIYRLLRFENCFRLFSAWLWVWPHQC